MARKSSTLLLLFILFCTAGFTQKQKIREIEKLTHEWAAANSNKDLDKLGSLYASSLSFYALNKDAATCLKEKRAFFEKYPNYSISIDKLDVDFYKSGIIRCNFVKIEVWNDKPRNPQQAYLLFEKEGKSYHIIAESDNRMDEQRGSVPQLGDKVQKSSNITYMLIGAGGLLLIGGVLFLIRKNKEKKKLESIPTLLSQPTSTEPSPSPAYGEDDKTGQIKGHEFEKYIADKFNKKYFQMITTRSDKKFENHTPATNSDPDFEFLYKGPPRPVNFAIECKWRSNYFNNTIELAKPHQFENYRNYQFRTGYPVFIIVGIGGLPSQPNDIYIVPLQEMDECVFTKEKLNRYYRHRKGNFFLEIQALKLQ